MYGSKHNTLHSQRGLSLSGLIVGLAIIGGLAVLGMRIFPSVMEYRSAKAGIANAKKQGGTPLEMRQAFNKHADVNMISSIGGQDLIVTKNNGDVELSFDYDSRITLFTDVYLGIHYAATTDPSGVIPQKPETAVQ
jgi:hypothetical protein